MFTGIIEDLGVITNLEQDDDNLHITLKSNFTNELKEYLDSKEDNYRLIFLLDEVSQYIGTNTSLLLNLQTIIVGLGSVTKNKVWIVCTAQQELESLKNQTGYNFNPCPL